MPTSPLFVRLPTREAEKLDRAAFELKTPKGKLVAGLVARYVDPTTPTGLEALRGLRLDDAPVVGRAYVGSDSEREVLTVREAAELLRVGEHTVRALAARGELPARRLGRRWRFSRRALLDWLAAPPRAAAGFRS